MELFRYRHLALGCVGFIGGLYVSYFCLGVVSRLVCLFLSLLCAFVFALLYLITKKRSVLDKFIKYAPLCFFIALAMLVSTLAYSRGEKILEYQAEACEISAEVGEVKWENESGGIYVIEITEIDGEKIKAEAVLQSYGTLLKRGNKISLNGEIHALSDEKYGFSEKNAYLDDGITVSVISEEITVINDEIKREGIFKGINNFLDSRLENNLNSDTYALFSALLLGNKDNLSQDVRRDFARLGISHVLALSGMHLSLLTTLFSLALSVFKVPKHAKLVLLIFVIAFFVALTGFSDSCLRAGLMMSIYFILRLLGKGADSLTSLFLSVTLILIVLPYNIFSLSLILSFLSMLACIVSSKIIRYAKINRAIKSRLPRYIIYTLITSLFVLGFTSFVSYIYFGEISILSPISNLILVPLFTGFIYFAPFLLLLCGVPYVSVPFVFIAERSTDLIEWLVGVISRFRGISMPLYGVCHAVGVFGILAVLIFALNVRRKYLFKALALSCVFITVFCAGSLFNFVEKHTSTYVSAHNLGGEDYVTVEDEGKIRILDLTNSKSKNKTVASSLAKSLKYAEIESYVLFNYSKTVSRYVEEIVTRNIVRELYVPLPSDEAETALYNQICEIAKNQGTRVAILGDELTLADTLLEINRTHLERSIYDSVSVSFKIDGVSVLYLGASSYEAFDYFAGKHAPNADALIFGSSGPKYKLEYTYDLNSVDYAIYMNDSYLFASQMVKNATQGKEFFIKSDYVRIKIQDT